MNKFSQYIILFCLLGIPAFTATSSARTVKIEPITITLLASTLHRTLSGILPLPIELGTTKNKFQGTIIIDSISRLAIGKNLLSVSGQLTGRNMVMQAKVGQQSIQIKLGKLILPVTCELSFRFDPGKKMLLLFPRFQKTSRSKSDDTVVSLLNSLSQEYQVPLGELDPLIWDMGADSVYLRLEPLDIRAGDNGLTLKLRPIAGKLP